MAGAGCQFFGDITGNAACIVDALNVEISAPYELLPELRAMLVKARDQVFGDLEQRMDMQVRAFMLGRCHIGQVRAGPVSFAGHASIDPAAELLQVRFGLGDRRRAVENEGDK